MSSRTKKRPQHFYAFLNNSWSKKQDQIININLASVDKGFYEDLINYDTKLRKAKEDLITLKTNGIKETVYCNKVLPQSWKNKVSYYDDLYRTMDEDHSFISYLGRGKCNHSMDNNNKCSKNKNRTFPKKTPKGTVVLNQGRSEVEVQEHEIPNLKQISISNQKKQEEITGTNNIMGGGTIDKPRKIAHLWERYTIDYPINFPKGFKSTSDRKTLPMLSSVSKNDTMKNTNTLNNLSTSQNQKNITKISLNSKFQASFGNEKMRKKAKVFGEMIFNNLTPSKWVKKCEWSSPLECANNIIKDREMYLKDGHYCFKHPYEIKTQKLVNNLKNINNFGPHYSNCPPCRDKTMVFYGAMDPNQSIQWINYLKSVRNPSN